MGDLVYVLVTVGFFGLAGLFVAACDRIVGPDPADGTAGGDRSPEPVTHEEVAIGRVTG